MPLYEFTCKDCDEQFETLVLSKDAIKAVRCKKCKSENVKKIISTPSYISPTSSNIPAGALSGCSSRSGFS